LRSRNRFCSFHLLPFSNSWLSSSEPFSGRAMTLRLNVRCRTDVYETESSRIHPSCSGHSISTSWLARRMALKKTTKNSNFRCCVLSARFIDIVDLGAPRLCETSILEPMPFDVSILQRTFNLNVMARPENGSEEDNQEFEFSMIDQDNFSPGQSSKIRILGCLLQSHSPGEP
jgi:hypothetical protein